MLTDKTGLFSLYEQCPLTPFQAQPQNNVRSDSHAQGENGSTILGWAPLNRAQLKLGLKKFEEAVLSTNSKGV